VLVERTRPNNQRIPVLLLDELKRATIFSSTSVAWNF